jgi:hypothetical protein
MDSNTIFTSLFGGWPKAADKARDRSTLPNVNSVYLGGLGAPHTLVCTYAPPGVADINSDVCATRCAEHVRQPGGESPPPNLMEVKG